MKYLICYIIFLTGQVTFAQKWKIGLGRIFTFDKHQVPALIVADSLAIFKTPRKTGISKKAPQFPQLYLERTLFTKERSQLSAGVSYRHRQLDLIVSQFGHGQELVHHTVQHRIHTFLFQLSGGVRPAKRLVFFAGLGIGVHFNGAHKSSDYLDNPDHYHPLFRETYEAARDIHRPITLNYHLSVRYALLKRLELIVHFDESIGNIDRKMRIDNVEYNYPMKWRNIGVMLAYRFSPSELARGFVNFLKPEKEEI